MTLLSQNVEADLKSALSLDPVALIFEIDRLEAEQSLYEFTKQAWHVLEPGTEFKLNWHLECICAHLERVTDSWLRKVDEGQEIRELLINIPPGTMKSMLVNIMWPAWEWGPKGMPFIRTISFSYAQALTVRDNRKMRMLIESDWYRRNWGNVFVLADDQNAKIKFENDKLGVKEATSMGGHATGIRGNRLILDDPNNVKEAESDTIREDANTFFAETLPTRVNDLSRDVQVCVQQRTHERDVSGYILNQELGWTHLMLPMEFEPDRRCFSIIPPSWIPEERWEVRINEQTGQKEYCQDPRQEEGELLFPAHFPSKEVEKLKKRLGSYAIAGQLQQRPAPREGGLFSKSWFEVVNHLPASSQIVYARGWDFAGTDEATSSNAAYTVGLKMAAVKVGLDKEDWQYYIVDVVRFRGRPEKVERTFIQVTKSDGKGVFCSYPQDPGQAGKSQATNFARKVAGYPARYSVETGSKADRAQGLSAQAEAGNVKLIKAPWNEEFLNEIDVFPMGAYLDQVDAASRAFHELLKRCSQWTPVVTPISIKR